jgi:nicotinate-nucleotide--dimethylbenzimidazole phosphoribosyltransferase
MSVPPPTSGHPPGHTSGHASAVDLGSTLAAIGPSDAAAAQAARERQRMLTKPPGSLGELEELGARLSAIAGTCPPPVPRRPAVAVFAGDHGVHAQGVTAWPQEVTTQMVANMGAGGAVVNALARQLGAEVTVVDVGVAGSVEDVDGVVHSKVASGTADLAVAAAMTPDTAIAALEVGIAVAEDLVARGADLLVTGDMGIANTTPAAALLVALTGRSAEEVTGRGAGIDDRALATKTAVVARAAARVRSATPLEVLAGVGGLEHAALAGFLLAGAARRVPVVVDGVIAVSAAVVAAAMAPAAADHWIAGHRSAEPGAAVGLDHLGLVPLLDLGLRLGEGSGAVLAVPVVQSAARVLGEVETFDGAGVTEK